MTRKQLYARLRKEDPKRWRVTRFGRIRRDDCCCPIEAVAGYGKGWAVSLAAPHIGLPHEDAVEVVLAADFDERSNPRTRAALLRALQLKEVER